MKAPNLDDVLQDVYELCKQDPSSLGKIIDCATMGVKSFANEQTNKSAGLQSVISDILDCNKNIKVNHFSKQDILDKLTIFKGTEWMKEIEEGDKINQI